MRRAVGPLLLVAAVTLLALVPVAARLLDAPFYLTLVGRIMIFAIAALSLDLILGYGGMVSFGHAAYLGVGVYTVGILSAHGVASGFVQWPAAIVASALIAAAIGAVSLRTSGVYFIMITLAFAQMLYFFGVSLKAYGGDDGMAIAERSRFAACSTSRTARSSTTWSWSCSSRSTGWRGGWSHSRFGMVVRGCRSNERADARRSASRRSGTSSPPSSSPARCAGVAGVLLANFTKYASPAFMHWTRSGEIMVMVILGGMGTVFGPALGALAFLLLEEVLSGYTEYWPVFLGPILVGIVLFAKRGLSRPRSPPPAPWLSRSSRRRADQALRRRRRDRRREPRGAAGRDPRRDRPERRRQDDARRPARGRAAPRRGPHPLRGRRRHRACRSTPGRRSGWRARSRSPASSGTSRCSTTWRSPSRPTPATASGSGGTRRDRAALREPARRRSSRSAWPGGPTSWRPTWPTASSGSSRSRMALATRPRLLLLDEPMAGMGPEEAAQMVALLGRLKRQRTLLLIEHDMDAVFALADRITVLVYGRVIATGSPDEIAASPEVRAAYLGDWRRA